MISMAGADRLPRKVFLPGNRLSVYLGQMPPGVLQCLRTNLTCGAAMAVPIVAIVGRPNVGKSSLFNWLAGRRIAIVDPTAGTTRDRLTALIEHDGTVFELMDTGGMGIQDSDNLTDQVEGQIRTGIDQAVAVLFVV